MSGFTKLWSDIVDSSIWEEDPETCKVWVTLLTLANEEGFVRGSIGWLASKAKVPVHKCHTAVAKFLTPDPKSRTTTDEGRRLKVVDRGWVILNYLYFRNERGALSDDPRTVYKREWMRKKRAKTGLSKTWLSTLCPQESTGIHTASASVQDRGTGEGKGLSEADKVAKDKALGRALIELKDLRRGEFLDEKDRARIKELKVSIAEYQHALGVKT